MFLDTPGVHKPRTLLGERANERALTTLAEVDVVCFVIEANAADRRGRPVRRRAARRGRDAGRARGEQDRHRRATTRSRSTSRSSGAELGDFAAYVPISAQTGDGVDALVGELEAPAARGSALLPRGCRQPISPRSFLAAELVREQLLAIAREELPHSIAVTTEEIEERETASGPLLALRVVVRVERDSQKGIVIGKGGAVLKAAGTAARLELEALLGTRVHLETHVKVDPDWQRRPSSLDRLGLVNCAPRGVVRLARENALATTTCSDRNDRVVIRRIDGCRVPPNLPIPLTQENSRKRG